MAKPDWGTLQQQFLTEHAKSGISPKEWCEEQGLKYSTAKRYIKIANGSANSQKKSANETANKRIRKTEQSTPSTNATQNEQPDNSQNDTQEKQGLIKPQHESFAQNIAQGMTQKDAAICAGYSPSNSESQAAVLIRRPDVRRRIRELRQEAALLVSFNAKDLADLSFKAAKDALQDKKFGQVAPNIKNAAQLTGIEMSTNKTEVNVDLAGLSYGKVCIVTPATCPPEVWDAHMERLREGKQSTQQ
ncbi:MULTISPECIES: terminase small subunit [Providencia]|uniref:Terminase small subunit n=3 Tax=Providencia TaxID=586 RepID=A0AAD2VT37_PRORE|nr:MULTISPECIES: terminase small subunit [Providencia]ELR5138153.1 terminase small subunit [Providencia rettgeri]ELR5168980.1 terminase small subunit [Providencia rettgeri]ELR5217838.1 terminase small subunit [Providencia rettgeri]MBN4863764.1 terminase small subunit [Providencia stuartii]MBN4873086.1 terminase small subunit [Providencia stuartii]